MIRILPLWGVCLLMLGSVGAHAADDPRSLIQRAIEAEGGADILRQKAATEVRFKGILHNRSGMTLSMQGRSLRQPGGPTRLDMVMEVRGAPSKRVLVLDGPRSWQEFDGTQSDLNEDQAKLLQSSAVRDRALRLLPLLEDKGFTLALLPGEDVDGKPVAGVKVSYKDQPDLNLYFDRATGEVVKYSYRAIGVGLGKEALHEHFLSGRRDVHPEAAWEEVLRAAGVTAKDRGLVEFLQTQAPSKERIEKARKLIRKLGDDAFEVREKASKELVLLGGFALPFLRAAVSDPDPEIARRARQCLEEIGEDSGNRIRLAAVHLAAARRPPGAAAALLDLLPGADAELTREIKAALYTLVEGTAKPDEAIVAALEDRDSAAKRSVARAVLGKDGGAYLKEPRRRVYPRHPRQAAKTRYFLDGNLRVEMEYEEPEYFNHFDAREFARP
jgi:hypothetical protein